MGELAEQVQQAYDRGGRDEAVTTFLETCTLRDWTTAELDAAVQLLRGFPVA